MVAALCELRCETAELDAIAQALLTAQNENLIAQRLAGPTREGRRFEIIGNPDAQGEPSLETRPALAPIALEQIEV